MDSRQEDKIILHSSKASYDYKLPDASYMDFNFLDKINDSHRIKDSRIHKSPLPWNLETFQLSIQLNITEPQQIQYLIIETEHYKKLYTKSHNWLNTSESS